MAPAQLHDIYRVDKGGKPTFDKVMRGLRLLQKHGMEYNVLTTVNRVNADYPLEVYRFLRDEVGTTWMQFIPVVERINEDGLTLYQEGTAVSDRSVLPEQFGRFLSVFSTNGCAMMSAGYLCKPSRLPCAIGWVWMPQACVFSTKLVGRA